jgi:6-phosphofructokinase 1
VLNGLQMLGVRRGYAGLIAGELIHLGPREVGGIIHQAGTMLETSRCEEFKTEDGQRAAIRQLQDHDISNLIVIGGNGVIIPEMETGPDLLFFLALLFAS